MCNLNIKHLKELANSADNLMEIGMLDKAHIELMKILAILEGVR